MKTSAYGKNIIKAFEGFRLKAYQDAGGVWTIGYGHTGKVDGKAIKAGMEISVSKASELFDQDIEKFEGIVNAYHDQYNWNQNEFDALVSFAYNIGSITQLTAKGTRTKQEIAIKMPSYYNMAKKYVKGLYVRRLKETLIFVQGGLA